jgi:hypothetical protein
MKRLLKEPLLHFVLLGAAIFVANSFVSKRVSEEPGKIVITQGEIENLAVGFAKAWQRAPAPDELADLIRDRVREEIYCREAMVLGLDKGDTVIRHRLRQKMEFISDDIATRAEPTDVELNAYLQTHPDVFRTEQRFTFRQVYLDPEKHGENLARDAGEMLALLNETGEKAEAAIRGDSLLLEHEFTAVPASELAKQFGEGFAAKLTGLQPGRWCGPIESAYGVHLVLLSERTEGRLPGLAKVRDVVRREWNNARRLNANEKFYQELLKRYAVTIEPPKPEAAQKTVAVVR